MGAVARHKEIPCRQAGAEVLKHLEPRAVTRMTETGRVTAIPHPDRVREVYRGKVMKSTAVKPVTPVAPYIGGKRNLANLITHNIALIPHEVYCEAFVGMGGVFFRRKTKPQSEVINDFNREVATLFRILQCHYQAFLDVLKWQITTRVEFDRLMKTRPETLTDLQRAARFLYLQRTAFGGKVAGRNFAMDATRGARFNLTKLEPMLEEVHERLVAVLIECLDYKDFIGRYDRKGVLFYLDPPYYGNETDYGDGLFGREEFEKMAALLKGIKGRFILSLNDRLEVRKTFGKFHLLPVKTTYTIAAGGAKTQAGELLISNVKLKGK